MHTVLGELRALNATRDHNLRIQEPVRVLEAAMEQQVPCFKKVLKDGTEVMWYPPPRDPGESETDYARRRAALWNRGTTDQPRLLSFRPSKASAGIHNHGSGL